MIGSGEQALRLVVFREEQLFVAQCLEYDLSGEGASPEDAVSDFVKAYNRRIAVGQHLGVDPFAELPPAPDDYWSMWRDRNQACTPKPFEIQTSEAQTRRAQLIQV